MLSRRRRVASSSFQRSNENINPDSSDVNVSDEKMEERHVVEELAFAAAFPSSTETSTTSRYDNRLFQLSTRHVDHFCNIIGNDGIKSKKVDQGCKRDNWREESSDLECKDGSKDVSLPMNLTTTKNCHRLTQCVRDNSRHRRRKSVGRLDRKVEVFQISFSTTTTTTNERVVVDSSSRFNESASSSATQVEQIQDSDVATRISNVDDFSSPSSSIYPKIPHKDKTIRTRKKTFDSARSRINSNRYDDAMREHKDSQRRYSTDDIPHEDRFPEETFASKKIRTSWTCRKSRWLVVIVGLFMWTTLMMAEVAARQNHHRTCPGCPHQHVHTINRKTGGFDDETPNSSDTETAPSPDDLRLEAIKHQILTKLGLRTRPDVNRTLASVPRHLALETLYRAEAQPPGHSIEFDEYHETRRKDHRHGNSEDEDSLSSFSSLSSSSSSISSSSSSSSISSPDSLSPLSSSSSSKISSLPSSSSSSSSSSPSSSSSYGQFYYDGAEYSYRNVDQSVLERDSSARRHGDPNESRDKNSHDDNERHRGRENYRNGGKSRDYTVTDDGGDDDDVDDDDDDDEGQIEMDDFYARTSEIISFAEPGRTLNGQPLLEFPRSSEDPALEPLRIKRATLWARVELRHAHHYQHHRRSQTNQRNITLWVFRVRCGNVTHLRGKELGEHLEMVTSLGVNVNQLGWQKFDVTKVVSSWYSGHELSSTRNEKLTLLVDCTGCGNHVHVSTFGIQGPQVVESTLNSKGEQDPDRPFLVVRTDPAGVKRVRRRAIECSGAIKGQCCKQRFYVSFSQLGWDDWIIAPQGYYANYCRGDCAAGHRTPDTFLNYYTHVIEEYRKMDRLAGMQPCCAPLKFSPMSLIYYGPDSNIIKRDLPKMVVDECGCP